MSRSTITRAHQRTYATIFRHPAARNLEWRDVRSLLAELADIEDEPDGNWKVTRNGQSLVLHADRRQDVAQVDEVLKIRHFLERSGGAAPKPDSDGPHLL